MVDIHELYEAKIKHILNSPNWEYDCNDDKATAHKFSQIPNMEYELLNALNEQKKREEFLGQGGDEEDESSSPASQETSSPDQPIKDCQCGDIEVDLDEQCGTRGKVKKKRRKRSGGQVEINIQEGSSRWRKCSDSALGDPNMGQQQGCSKYCSHEWEEDEYLPEMLGTPHSSENSDSDEEDDPVLIPIYQPPFADNIDPSLFQGYTDEDDRCIDKTKEKISEELSHNPGVVAQQHSTEDDSLSPLTPELDSPSDTLTLFTPQEWSTQAQYELENPPTPLTPMTPVDVKLKKLNLNMPDGYCFTFVSDETDDDDEEDVVHSSTTSTHVYSNLLNPHTGKADSPLHTPQYSSLNFEGKNSKEPHRALQKGEESDNSS